VPPLKKTVNLSIDLEVITEDSTIEKSAILNAIFQVWLRYVSALKSFFQNYM
jgi:hypothetical protein